MLNSNPIRALLCVMLCSVPVVASISDDSLQIRVGGAESRGQDHYAVKATATVSLAVNANPGDTIWVYAVGPRGDTLTLILARPKDGRAYAEFQVPAGTQGQSFKIHAMAQDLDGGVREARPVRLDVMKDEPTDPIFR